MDKLWIYIRCILILFIFITFMPQNSGAVLFPEATPFAGSFSNASIGLSNNWIGSGTSFLVGSNTFNNFSSPFPSTGFGNFSSTGFLPSSSTASFISSAAPFSAFSSTSFGAPAANLWSTSSNSSFGSLGFSNTSFPGFTSNTGLGNFSGITSSLSNSFAPSFGAFNTASPINFPSVSSFSSLSSTNFSSAPSFNSLSFSTGTPSFGSNSTFLGGQSITTNSPISQNPPQVLYPDIPSDLPSEIYTKELLGFDGIWVGTWSAHTDVIINENTKEREKISGDVRFDLYEYESSNGDLFLGGTMEIYGWDLFAGEIADVTCSLSRGLTIVYMFADYKNLEILWQISVSDTSIADKTFAGRFNLMNTDSNPRSGTIEVQKY